MTANQSLSKVTPVDDLALTVLESLRREYPHMLHQQLNSDDDLLPPRTLNPCFFGSYDWHSAVHCHWALLHYLQAGCSKAVELQVVQVLDEHLTHENIARELAFFQGPSGLTSERPYGWAWLLLLEATCRTYGERFEPAVGWSEALRPLANYLQAQLLTYFSSTLAFPIRAGTHRNSAFSLHLCLQAARLNDDVFMADAFSAAAVRLFQESQRLRWDEDVSGDAFLTPSLTEAALMADSLSEGDFLSWLAATDAPISTTWGVPSFKFNGEDPATVHLEGLLISRAWGFEAIRRAVPNDSPTGTQAQRARDEHLRAVREIDPTNGFTRSHWLPSFLCYLEDWLREIW